MQRLFGLSSKASPHGEFPSPHRLLMGPRPLPTSISFLGCVSNCATTSSSRFRVSRQDSQTMCSGACRESVALFHLMRHSNSSALASAASCEHITLRPFAPLRSSVLCELLFVARVSPRRLTARLQSVTGTHKFRG